MTLTITNPAHGAAGWDTQVNANFASIKANVTQSSNGVIMPVGFGANSVAKKAAAIGGTGLWRIAIPGTSIELGGYASDVGMNGVQGAGTSWVALLKKNLQNLYGDGGSGFVGVTFTQTVLSNDGAASATYTAWQAGSQVPTTTGTWTASSTGPAGASLKCDTSSASGATVTFKVRGTKVGVIWASPNSGTTSGTFTWTVDGTAQGTVTPSYNTSAFGFPSATVAAGVHTIVVTTTGSTGFVFIGGAYGYNTSGVVIDNFCHWGAQAAGTFCNSDAWHSGTASGGYNHPLGTPADLVLYALDVNDAHAGTTAAAWQSRVQQYLQGVLDSQFGGTATGTTDVAFLVHAVANDDNTTLPVFSQFASAIRGYVDTYTAAVVNAWAVSNRSYQWMLGQNYMGSSTTMGIAGTDNIHLSDAGHTWLESLVRPIFTGI